MVIVIIDEGEDVSEKCSQCPNDPLLEIADALLKVAPHNVLLVLTTSMSSLGSGGARPRVITNPSERGEKAYLKQVY